MGLTTLLLVQALRVLFPLAYNLGERTSFITAGVFALALSFSPFVAPLLIRPLGLRRAVAGAVSGLALARLTIQVVHPVPLWLASVAVVLGLLALTTVVVAMRGGRRLAAGIVLGLAVDTALRSASWTWDYAWQDGFLPIALTVAAGAGAALLAFRVSPLERTPVRGVLGHVALGPFLFLQLLFLQSPAFVASAGGFSLPWATAFVLISDAMALWYLAFADRNSRLGWWVGGLALVVIGALLPFIDQGLPIVILTGQGMAVSLLARALQTSRPADGAWRAVLTVGLGSFVFMLLTLLYYLHYDSPLPFPNTVLPVVAAVVIASSAIGTRTVEGEASPSWAAVPLALLVVPAGMVLLGSDAQPAAAPEGTFRLIDYNVHNGVSPPGQLNPEAIARVIEAERPDVVTLNEVNRGWAIAGTIDLAEWLSQRLDLPYVYGKAADGQFGNAVMSRFPITRVERLTLPKAAGPMVRNATLATLDLGNSRVVDVVALHLDHRDEGRVTRLADRRAPRCLERAAGHGVRRGHERHTRE
jgi:hypothetical protein